MELLITSDNSIAISKECVFKIVNGLTRVVINIGKFDFFAFNFTYVATGRCLGALSTTQFDSSISLF